MRSRGKRRNGWRLLLIASMIAVAAPLAAGGPEGFLFGEITTRSGGSYQGRLRWNEEASWIDHFDAEKESDEGDRSDRRADERERRSLLRVLDDVLTLRLRFNRSDGRATMIPFGDIDRIDVIGRNEADVVLKSGSTLRLSGGINDIGSDVRVWDETIGEIEVRWDEIETVDFMPTPGDLVVAAYRLHGTVETADEEFEGFIQWDKDESLSTDTLDGDTGDGRMAIKMGRIRTIERRSTGSSKVTLRDGRDFVLRSNRDVSSSNQGIFVDDPRFGRVLVPWSVFRRVEFSDRQDSGPSYSEFKPGRLLRGTVEERDGETHSGTLHFDLDEREDWELLNGFWQDLHYHIPFSRISSIVPLHPDGSLVTLTNGEELELEEGYDVNSMNRGIAVSDGGAPVVKWNRVKRIDFER